MRIAVAGGTGTVGRHVIDAATAAGHSTVVLSRSAGFDLASGTDLVPVLRGVDAVIDVSDRSTTSVPQSVRFFTAVTRNLLAAGRRAGVAHHVALSIIGATPIDASYYAGKAAQERLLQAEPGGWSLLRTAQFHEFVPQTVRVGRLGTLQVVPTMRSQPVAAIEVAAELVALAEAGPSGNAPDLAGPREENMADLVRRYLAATGTTRPVLQVPLPGRFGRGMRDGSLLPAPGAHLGRTTFADWLADRRTDRTG